MRGLSNIQIGRVKSSTPITGTAKRWSYVVTRLTVTPENTYSDPDEILESEGGEDHPGLNLAEMENTALATRGYSASNIPESFTVKPAEGMAVMFPVHMVFSTEEDADPEFGFLFFSINAIDGGCS